jgi:hypothetical protein
MCIRAGQAKEIVLVVMLGDEAIGEYERLFLALADAQYDLGFADICSG